MMQRTNTRPAVLRIAILSFFAFGAVSLMGQSKYTEDAERAFERGAYAEAAQEYLRNYSKLDGVDAKGEANFMIGECYRLMLNYEAAAEYYEKAIVARYDDDNPEVQYRFGQVLQSQNKFDDAIEKYNEYKEKGGDKTKANAAIDECEALALAMDEPPSRYIVEQIPMLNSEQFDYAPSWADKREDEIIFASSRPSSAGSDDDPITGESYMDLFKAELDKKGKWSTPVPVNNTVNTPNSEGGVCFDSRYKRMYFTRCIDEKKATLACDIYYADMRGRDFGPAEPMNLIDREVNDSSQVGHPALTPDDEYLVFVSDMPGGYGGKDLWYVKFDRKNDKWGSPKNLGEKVNTPEDEMFPYFRGDTTLYFSSRGHGSMGGLDIFSASFLGEEMQFGDVERLPAPINSSADDFGLIFKDDEDMGLFSSNRMGGKGKDDIYEFKMPPLEFNYIANVYDFDTGTPLANAKVMVQGTDGNSYELTADGNGGVKLDNGEITKETNYSVDVSLDGYIGTGDQFSTVGLSESTTFAREYFLKEIVLDKEYDLPLVLYPFDKSELLINEEVNSADSLDYLYDLMERNPNFVIQLESHTDTRGSADYNQRLSQARAETCVEYLIGKGIAADRIEPVGKGESDPKISDAEINTMATEEEQEKAHQTNRRTVFRILRYDYVPKDQRGE